MAGNFCSYCGEYISSYSNHGVGVCVVAEEPHVTEEKSDQCSICREPIEEGDSVTTDYDGKPAHLSCAP